MSELHEATAQEGSAPAPATRPGRWHYVGLILIIALGAALRLAYLDRPVLWGDEAATWARTCGDFREMLEHNRGDGFVPLHYELYWAMGKAWKLSTWSMRIVPAIGGALMVPAMYFLARQLVRPRVALLVALFTAVSAFMLSYSRDAKMYMHFWLFATLHMALFLWWLRGAGGVAWWGWVAAGVAAVGLHSAGWLLVPVGLVIFLTYRRWSVGWRPALRWALYLIGLAIIGVGPAVYYLGYNNWAEQSGGIAPGLGAGNSGAWYLSGIAWVELQTRNKTSLELVRDSATAYLYGYSRAEEDATFGPVEIPQWVLDTAWGTLAVIAVLMLIGAVKWPARAPEAPLAGAVWAPWRLNLWLAFWLVFPAYGFFYCRSISEPTSPHYWIGHATAFVGWHWLWVFPAVLVLTWLAGARRWVTYLLAWTLFAGIAAVVGISVWQARREWYLSLMDLGAAAWIVAGLLVLACAVSWGAMPAPGRWRRVLGLVVVSIVVLGLCEGAWWLLGILRRRAEQSGSDWHSVWMPRYIAIIWPALAIVVAIAFARLPSRVLRIAAVVAFCGVNLVQYAARIYMDTEPHIDFVARDVVRGERTPDLRVYVRDRGVVGSPGTGCMGSIVGRFYLAWEIGGVYTISDMRMGPTESMVAINHAYSPRTLAYDLRRRREVQRVVLWEKLSLAREKDPQALLTILGSGWRLESQWSQEMWRHWNWQHLDTLRRLEFVRTTPPVTAPARIMPQPAPPASQAEKVTFP